MRTEIAYLNRRQASEADPSWDYENEGGTLGMHEGWYVYVDGLEVPRGPWRTRSEAQRCAAAWERAS